MSSLQEHLEPQQHQHQQRVEQLYCKQHLTYPPHGHHQESIDHHKDSVVNNTQQMAYHYTSDKNISDDIKRQINQMQVPSESHHVRNFQDHQAQQPKEIDISGHRK
ncbi:hypothetical protein HDU76_008769, partial [Blyttiomyces sp. JEL0837]